MHIIEVIKRNGSVVQFNKDKIEKVLEKIDKEVKYLDKISIKQMMNDIETKINGSTRISVESIQDIVFYTLCKNNLFEQAKAFQTYRTQRAEQRLQDANSVFRHMTDIVDIGDRENSNKNSMLPSVQRDLIAGEYFRYILERNIDKELWAAHRKKTIHWHDSDVDTKLTNCCLFNIEDMLRNGTRITNADVCQPNSVGTAMNIAMQIMASISASQYGGVSLPNFNEVFAEYAKKNFKKNFMRAYNDRISSEGKISAITEADVEAKFGKIGSDNEKLAVEEPVEFAIAKERTAKDIYDACQLFEYQTNSILGSASQTPFSTITFNIPTSWESEQIILSYLKVRQTGLGEKHIPAIFPKLSYMAVDGYNLREGDKYFFITKEVSKCIANTYYPDILFYSKEDYDAGKYYARMGCRSRVNHEYQEDGKYQHYGRFNYGVTTLNVPQIALDVLRQEHYEGAEGGRLERFLELLSTRKVLMKKAIEARFNNVKHLQAKKAPILFQYGGIARLDPEDTIEEILKTDRASVSYGFLGLDDAVRILSDDKENISTPEGHKMGLTIMAAIREQADEIKKETGLPVSLYGTPAESSIATFFNKDVENYGDVMPEWLREREYYTNSFHYSSELPIDSFDKIDVEAPFIKYCNGGNIMYVENGGKTYNSDAIIELIQYAHDAGIEYFAVNTISDVCYECGYTGEITYNEKTASYKCPHCGNEDGMKMKIQRRCCGYISNYNITHALEGRMKEIKNRAIHVK